MASIFGPGTWAAPAPTCADPAAHRRCRRDQVQPQQVRAAIDRDQPGWRAARQPAQDGGFSRDTDAQSVLGTFSFVLVVLVRSSWPLD